MAKYKTNEGDTFESISLRATGTKTNADVIAKLNSGVVEPILGGASVSVPNNLTLSLQAPRVTSEAGLVVVIDGTRFQYWETLALTKTYDSVSTFAFEAPLSPDKADFRRLIQPLSYHGIEIYLGDSRILTGTMLSSDPQVTEDRAMVSVEGYGTPGVLMDCTPAATQQLGFDEQSLQQIARELLKPFGIEVRAIENAGNTKLERVSLNVGERIFPFLKKIAKEQGEVLSDDAEGNLVIKKEGSQGVPVATLKQGEAGLKSIKALFNPQEYFSEIAVTSTFGFGASFKKTAEGETDVAPSYSALSNPKLSKVFRPNVSRTTEHLATQTKTHAKSKLARMFANVVVYEAVVPSWFNQQGGEWEPGDYVSVEAPYAFIYEPFVFLIREVEFKKGNSEEAVLRLVIPGVFNGKVPGAFPWE